MGMQLNYDRNARLFYRSLPCYNIYFLICYAYVGIATVNNANLVQITVMRYELVEIFFVCLFVCIAKSNWFPVLVFDMQNDLHIFGILGKTIN